MRREMVLVVMAAVAVVGVLATWPSVSAAEEVVRLEGHAEIQGDRRRAALTLSAESADGGCRLEGELMASPLIAAPGGRRVAALISYAADDDHDDDDDDDDRGRGDHDDDDDDQEEREEEGGQGLRLAGTYTLGTPDGPAVSGEATGEMAADGFGSLLLEDREGMRSMTADFLIEPDGRLQVDLAGVTGTGRASVAAASIDPSGPDGDHTFWFISRAAGLTAYLVLFLNVFLGLAVHTRQLDVLLARWRSFDLHQYTALLGGGLLLLHALALLEDSYTGFTPAQLVVPFASPYRPLWTAVGIVAFYTLAAVLLSSYLRRFIGHRSWRAIHFLSFGAFLLSLGHGVLAGTDSGQPWAAAMYGGTGTVIALLTAMRFRTARAQPVARPASADVSQAAAPRPVRHQEAEAA